MTDLKEGGVCGRQRRRGGGGGWFEKEAIFIDTRVEAEGEEVTKKNLKRENCQV